MVSVSCGPQLQNSSLSEFNTQNIQNVWPANGVRSKLNSSPIQKVQVEQVSNPAISSFHGKTTFVYTHMQKSASQRLENFQYSLATPEVIMDENVQIVVILDIDQSIINYANRWAPLKGMSGAEAIQQNIQDTHTKEVKKLIDASGARGARAETLALSLQKRLIILDNQNKMIDQLQRVSKTKYFVVSNNGLMQGFASSNEAITELKNTHLRSKEAPAPVPAKTLVPATPVSVRTATPTAELTAAPKVAPQPTAFQVPAGTLSTADTYSVQPRNVPTQSPSTTFPEGFRAQVR